MHFATILLLLFASCIYGTVSLTRMSVHNRGPFHLRSQQQQPLPSQIARQHRVNLLHSLSKLRPRQMLDVIAIKEADMRQTINSLLDEVEICHQYSLIAPAMVDVVKNTLLRSVQFLGDLFASPDQFHKAVSLYQSIGGDLIKMREILNGVFVSWLIDGIPYFIGEIIRAVRKDVTLLRIFLDALTLSLNDIVKLEQLDVLQRCLDALKDQARLVIHEQQYCFVDSQECFSTTVVSQTDSALSFTPLIFSEL